MQASSNGWENHERDQLRARLALSYAERLRWLEQAKRFAQSAIGAANTDAARIATLAQKLWPGARVAIRKYDRGWSMDIAAGKRFFAIEYRANEGFGASELRDTVSDAFTGHDSAFPTVVALEAHLTKLV